MALPRQAGADRSSTVWIPSPSGLGSRLASRPSGPRTRGDFAVSFFLNLPRARGLRRCKSAAPTARSTPGRDKVHGGSHLRVVEVDGRTSTTATTWLSFGGVLLNPSSPLVGFML